MSVQLEWDVTPRLVDLLIEEQQTLSAVDDFSAYHDAGENEFNRYEALIPSGLPGSDQQFAFRVDLDACTGCKACVTACHSLNGLEEGEVWRKVGLVEERLGSTSLEMQDQQIVTTACHHCDSPACLSGCPVQAYEKDPTTGIVRHLDDQCIGCRYCQLMCPYDVPAFSERLGVVRKCDMCHGRLAVGEAPACVQGCPNEAISIAIVDSTRVIPASVLPVIPGSMPESKWTRPMTNYVSSQASRKEYEPSGLANVNPSEAHAPLAVMLVLTQASIGAICLEALFSVLPGSSAPPLLSRALVLSIATTSCLVGLGASFLHLGRPLWAFRAVLGLRTSWMSREIMMLGVFAIMLVAASAIGWADWALAMGWLSESWASAASTRGTLIVAAVVIGLLGLYCSIQIYAVTGRPLWRFDRTTVRFVSTAVWAGVAISNLGLSIGALEIDGLASRLLFALPVALMAISIVKIKIESGYLVTGRGDESLALARTQALLSNALARESNSRRGLLMVAGCLLPVVQLAFVLVGVGTGAIVGVAAFSLMIGLRSEFLERDLFFRSEAMPGMPGVG